MVKCSAKSQQRQQFKSEGSRNAGKQTNKEIVLQTDMQLPVPERVGWP
jgi:hypothetical protein